MDLTQDEILVLLMTKLDDASKLAGEALGEVRHDTPHRRSRALLMGNLSRIAELDMVLSQSVRDDDR